MKHLTCSPIGKYISDWGEGPIWHDGALWYVDISGQSVARLDPSTGSEQQWPVGELVGTIVPTARPGEFLIAGATGIHQFSTANGVGKTLADPEPELHGHTRFNDGKCDPAGRFWAGTISTRKQVEAALYMLDNDGTIHRKLTGITNSNGICWSHNRTTMFYIDTPTKKIETFDYDDVTGEISNRQVLVDTATLDIVGSPDGMTIDAEGLLWVAFCHGGCVVRFHASTGIPLAQIDVPAIETTACAFGGPDLNQLFITTGSSANADGPLDGSVFVCEPGVRGVPASLYQSSN